MVPEVLLNEPRENVPVPVTVGELNDGDVNVIPARVKAPLALVKSTDVVPMFTDGRRAEEIVPDEMFVAFNVVKFAPETAPNEPDQVPEVIVPTEVRDEKMTFEARVVPVNEPAAAAPPTIIASSSANAVFKALEVMGVPVPNEVVIMQVQCLQRAKTKPVLMQPVSHYPFQPRKRVSLLHSVFLLKKW